MTTPPPVIKDGNAAHSLIWIFYCVYLGVCFLAYVGSGPTAYQETLAINAINEVTLEAMKIKGLVNVLFAVVFGFTAAHAACRIFDK